MVHLFYKDYSVILLCACYYNFIFHSISAWSLRTVDLLAIVHVECGKNLDSHQFVFIAEFKFNKLAQWMLVKIKD